METSSTQALPDSRASDRAASCLPAADTTAVPSKPSHQHWKTLKQAQQRSLRGQASRAQDVIDKTLEICDKAFEELLDSHDDPFETVRALSALVSHLEKMTKIYSKLNPQDSSLSIAMEVIELVGEALKNEGQADLFDAICNPVAQGCIDRYGSKE